MADHAVQRLKEPATLTRYGAAGEKQPLGVTATLALFATIAVAIVALHAPLLRLPYFWDEAGYYIPAARDLLGGSLIPHSTPSNAHPPLVMGWLALSWKIFAQSQLVTRVAMLLLAAFSLTGFYRLARSVANSTVAAASTFLTAIYPVLFAQSSLAQIDLPAAGLTFWALEAYVRKRWACVAIWFSLAALTKETAVLVPVALAAWEFALRLLPGSQRFPTVYFLVQSDSKPGKLRATRSYVKVIAALSCPAVALAVWYAYHYARTGFVFGNPEFLRYNLQGNFHPVRILLALLLRLWQTFGYMNLYVLTLACLLAMKYPAQLAAPGVLKNGGGMSEEAKFRARIDIPVQLGFAVVAAVYLLALSVLGGAPLARYMLPIVPLFILIAVSTIWRRLRPWKAVVGIVAMAFITALFVNPPYGFSPEDNLAYHDYIHLHQKAAAFLAARYPHARVLTAWPASDELSRPAIGYVRKPMQVVRIEDFSAEEVVAAADERSRFDVALVFSTKVQTGRSWLDHWWRWQDWKTQYFGYHMDLGPEAAASVLGGKLVYVDRSPRLRQGQWVGVIEIAKVEETKNHAANKWHECVFTITQTCLPGCSPSASRVPSVKCTKSSSPQSTRAMMMASRCDRASRQPGRTLRALNPTGAEVASKISPALMPTRNFDP